jgi:hypothetical protein
MTKIPSVAAGFYTELACSQQNGQLFVLVFAGRFDKSDCDKKVSAAQTLTASGEFLSTRLQTADKKWASAAAERTMNPNCQ